MTRISIRTVSVFGSAIVGLAGLITQSASGSIGGFEISWCKNFSNGGGQPPAWLGNGWQITSGAPGERRSFFHPTPQDITSSFTASFTYQLMNNATGNHQGVTFCLVKTMNCDTPPLGSSGAGFGYSGIPQSKAISIQLNTINNGVTYTGICTNGGIPANPPATSPVNAFSLHPIEVTVEYDAPNQFFNITMVDTVSGQQYQPFPIFAGDLSATLASPTAYVGFTASTLDCCGTAAIQKG
jgi:hypothetical protein